MDFTQRKKRGGRLHQPSAKLPVAGTCVAAIAGTSCVARLATAA
jgi:hypothetical protein